MSAFTYPEVGATRELGELPPGYHHVHHRARIAHGDAAFRAVVEGLMTWAVHRRSGLRVDASGARAEVGTTVKVGLGVGPIRLHAPCRVVWTVDENDRRGFAYGTLPGHPARGEEAFVAERAATGDVWFTVTAFSRPAAWYARLGGPLTRTVQQLATRRYADAARQIATSAGRDHD